MRIRDILLSACVARSIFAAAGAARQISTTELLSEVPQCAVSGSYSASGIPRDSGLEISHVVVGMPRIKSIQVDMQSHEPHVYLHQCPTAVESVVVHPRSL
jgi:hypothetical protein